MNRVVCCSTMQRVHRSGILLYRNLHPARTSSNTAHGNNLYSSLCLARTSYNTAHANIGQVLRTRTLSYNRGHYVVKQPRLTSTLLWQHVSLTNSNTFCRMHVSSSTAADKDVLKDATGSQSYRVIYRFPFITGARFISRLKVIQTVLTFGMVPVCGLLYLNGSMGVHNMVMSLGIATFASSMLLVMSEFFRKAVGLLSINNEEDTVRISHMNFWGKRVDEFLPISDIVPLADASERASDMFVKVHTYSNPNQVYYLFLKHGDVRDYDMLTKIFGSLTL